MEKLWDFLNRKNASTYPIVISEFKFSLVQGRCCLTRRRNADGQYALVGVCSYLQRLYEVTNILSDSEYEAAALSEWRIETVRKFLETKFSFLESYRLAVISVISNLENSWLIDVTSESYLTVYYYSSNDRIERSSFDCIKRELAILVKPDAVFSELMKKFGVRVIYGQERTVFGSLPCLL